MNMNYIAFLLLAMPFSGVAMEADPISDQQWNRLLQEAQQVDQLLAMARKACIRCTNSSPEYGQLYCALQKAQKRLIARLMREKISKMEQEAKAKE